MVKMKFKRESVDPISGYECPVEKRFDNKNIADCHHFSRKNRFEDFDPCCIMGQNAEKAKERIKKVPVAS